MKRVLSILAFPFILIYSVLSLPFKIAWIIGKDIIQNRSKKSNNKNLNDTDFFDIGNLLYADCKGEFQEYYNSFSGDINQFSKKYQHILQNQHNKNLTPIEALYLFGDFKKKTGFIDWKGEENEYEIEEFIETQVTQKVTWTKVSALRSAHKKNTQRDGKFIIELFKASDKDLQIIDTRLLFFELGWDAYVFVPVKQKVYKKILDIAPNDFRGVDGL